MGIYSERDSFVYQEQEEDSKRYDNIEITENTFLEKDEFSDLGWNNNLSNSYQSGALASSGRERIEYREYGDSFDSEKFSPNPQSPIPNPQSPIPKFVKYFKMENN